MASTGVWFHTRYMRTGSPETPSSETLIDLQIGRTRNSSYLMHHPGKVISRTELMEHVYDRHFDSDSNVLEVLLGRIRRKVGADLIQTVRGKGYRLAAPDAI